MKWSAILTQDSVNILFVNVTCQIMSNWPLSSVPLMPISMMDIDGLCTVVYWYLFMCHCQSINDALRCWFSRHSLSVGQWPATETVYPPHYGLKDWNSWKSLTPISAVSLLTTLSCWTRCLPCWYDSNELCCGFLEGFAAFLQIQTPKVLMRNTFLDRQLWSA